MAGERDEDQIDAGNERGSDFGLETLEQRIVLSGDVTLNSSDPTPNDPVQVVDAGETTTQSPATPDPTGEPSNLVLVGSSGSETALSTDGVDTPLTVSSGQTLTGKGTVTAALTNDGTIAPGNSPGVLSVASYDQDASATLSIEISGVQPASEGLTDAYDQLLVSGTAALDGTLEVSFLDDFTPTAGQVFDIIRWSQRTGSFSNFTGLYAGNGVYMRPVYSADRLQLVATSIPVLDQLNVVGDEAQGVVDEWLTGLVNQVPQELTLSASLDLSGMRVSGDWSVTVFETVNGWRTRLSVADGTASWGMAGLTGGLTDVAGTYEFGAGAPSLTMTASGALSAFGGASLSGDFAIAYDAATDGLQVTASGVSARLGNPAHGASALVSGAALNVRMQGGAFEIAATGTGAIDGLPGFGFTGQLGFEASTASGKARFVARDAQVVMPDLGTLSGDFVFATSSQTTETHRIHRFVIGADEVSGSLTLGALSSTLSAGRLGVVVESTSDLSGIGEVQTTKAVYGQLDLGIAIDDAFALTGRNIQVAYSTATDTTAERIELLSGEALWLDVAAGAATAVGQFEATIDGVLAFSGHLQLDISTTTRLLSDASTVRVVEYSLTGRDVSAGFGGSNGLEIDRSDFVLVYSKEKTGSRSWVASRGGIYEASVAGYMLPDLEVAQWSINRAIGALPDVPTIDWSVPASFDLGDSISFVLDQVGDVFTVPVSGAINIDGNVLSGDLSLTYDRTDDSWTIDFDDLTLVAAAAGVAFTLSQGTGQLRIDSNRKVSGTITGAMSVTGVEGMTIDATGSVTFASDSPDLAITANGAVAIDGFARIQGDFSIQRQETAEGERFVIAANDAAIAVGTAGNGVSVSDVDLAMVLQRDALGAAGVAMVANGAVALDGLGGDLSLSAANGSVLLNTLGTPIQETITVGGQILTLAFEDELEVKSVAVSGLSVSVAGGPTLTGDARITSRNVAVGGSTRRQLEIGFDNLAVSGISMGGAAATLSDASGAVLVFKDSAGATKYAVQAEGSVALTGLAGVSFSATDMALSLNRTGRAIDTQIATATGYITLDQAQGETRLTGQASAAVDGVMAVSGQIFLEHRAGVSLPVKTGAGETATFETITADMLVIGGLDLSADLSAGDASVVLGDVDMALALTTEVVTGTATARRWITTSASLSEARVDAYADVAVTTGMLEINRGLAADGSLLAVGTPVLDFSGDHSILLPLGDSQSMALINDTERFTAAVVGAVQIGGVNLIGKIHVSEYTDTSGNPAWEVRLGEGELTVSTNDAAVTINSVEGAFYVTTDGVSGTVSGVARSSGWMG